MKLFIHGLLGSGQGFKGQILRSHFPDILTPEFPGTLDQRMARLEGILAEHDDWTLIGSSLGGLMATMATCARPQRVARLVLLAPALIWHEFADHLPPPVPTPTIIYAGQRDKLIPLDALRLIAEQVFTNLDFRVADDDHRLHATTESIDWVRLLAD